MALLMIKCPHTARPVCTGVELEKAQLEQLPDVQMQVSCQACGMTHAWWKRESWLADYTGRTVTEAPPIVRRPRRSMRL
jgi:hypothetical protein